MSGMFGEDDLLVGEMLDLLARPVDLVSGEVVFVELGLDERLQPVANVPALRAFLRPLRPVAHDGCRTVHRRGDLDADSNVLEERMDQELEVTESSLYWTADDFGVQFTVANRRGAPVTSPTVHVDLMGADDEILDGYTASFPETESIDDLATNETWSSDVVFENTDPSVVFNNLVAYRIWVTAEAEGTAPANASSSGVPSANGTADSDATNASTMGNDTISNDTTADRAMSETEMTNSST